MCLFNSFPLLQYSDLAEAEHTLILEKFRQATIEWNQNIGIHLEDGCDNGNQGQKSFMIVVTDACLPLVASGETPIAAHILINYELPTKKVPLNLFVTFFPS